MACDRQRRCQRDDPYHERRSTSTERMREIEQPAVLRGDCATEHKQEGGTYHGAHHRHQRAIGRARHK